MARGGHGEASTSDRSHSTQNDWADVHGRHFYLGNLGDLQGAGNGSGSCLPTGTKVELSMYATSLACLFPGEECPLILQRYVDGRRETESPNSYDSCFVARGRGATRKEKCAGLESNPRPLTHSLSLSLFHQGMSRGRSCTRCAPHHGLTRVSLELPTALSIRLPVEEWAAQ